MAEERKRELALPPGTYAYVLDSTKGVVKMYVGPTVINATGQDRPVVFNPETFVFDECTLEEAMKQNIVVPEGFYAVLMNPAKKENRMIYPTEGTTQASPDLAVGLKENIPGPVTFALFPGQMCEVHRGHHLRSNEYLRIKINNEERAKENWKKAVVKQASDAGGQPTESIISQAPADIAVGKQYNVLGTEVAFYIPPTGVSVVPDGYEDGKPVFVRPAETLEQLEYSILVDEDGNKEYPRGPAVVFPRPTQIFLKDKNGNRKFRAVEMNELQGIQLKMTKDVELTFADASKHPFKAGDEVFITGKEMPIYYPEEGHQLVRYDGKTIHYAVAVPDGEARYVMDRKSGEIKTEEGPQMLLPDPTSKIIVRRALSDFESMTWFPGADGNGSKEALDYNRWLRQQAGQEPTTRQGVVSEGRLESQGVSPSAPIGAVSGGSGLIGASSVGGFDAMDSLAMNYNAANAFSEAALERGVSTSRRQAKKSMVPESRQGKSQEAMVADVAERKSTYNEPRTLTFASKYKGVPTIRVRQGYAVQIANADGDRRVVVGPATALLEYAATLDVLSLSTGKPKTTDRLVNTAYLIIKNNKVSDILECETADHVKVHIKLSYNVNFEGDSAKWFTVENYVKHLCDHGRSVLKGRIRKVTIEDFYKNSTDLIRDFVLGAQPAPDASGKKQARPGMAFDENGMRVTDVEVLACDIVDTSVAQLLAQSQLQVVQQNINLAQAKARLDAVKQTELLKQEEALATATTEQKKIELEQQQLTARLGLDLDRINADVQKQAELRKRHEAEESIKDFIHEKALDRQVEAWKVEDARTAEQQQRSIEWLKEQTTAVAGQMQAIDPTLAAALMSTSAQETLVKVAEKLSMHQIFGGENAVDVLRKVFANTPLEAVILKALGSLPSVVGTNGSAKSSSSPVA